MAVNQSTKNSGANKRLGFILLTVVFAFFIGIFAKKILLG
jgi:hypothetical protein